MNAVPFEEVRDVLTRGGNAPIECSFLVGGVIYIWGPSARLAAYRIERNDLYQACVNYLHQQGRDFPSLDRAIDVARRERWPHWDRLPPPPETN